MPPSILERTVNGEFTEPGIVQATAHNAVSETPSTSSQPLAAAHNAVASDPAPPPTSASTAEQKLRVQDTEAATDARAHSKLSATPDAATSSVTDVPAIAAPAASQAATAAIADLEARLAPLLTGFAKLKASFLKHSTPASGPDAPTRSPDKDPEHDA
ncbi:hypothetical protein AAVH_12863 [Aphelenchoides avenae]|nr:hypothetical protein AAVH_12863 [Aphelenchus avenae]